MIHRYLAEEKLGTLPSSPPKMMKSECLKKHNIQSHPMMSDTGSGNSQISPSKPCVEHNVSESEMNMGNKRRKFSFSTPVALKSENHEAHLEPVVLKRKRHYENQILPEQKQALEDKGTEIKIDRLQNKIRKKCRKRRSKLFQKQNEQHREFNQFWEKKMLDLQRDYKLELSIVRCIHGEGKTRTQNKLKLLDDGYEKKIKEHNLLKDEEHKKLQAEQWAARDEERKKEDQWLAACRSGEQMTDHGPGSVGLCSEEAGCDVPNGNSSNSLGTDPQIIWALPAFRECVTSEIGAVELNKEVPPKVPETVPNEIVDCADPVELSNSTSDKGIENGDVIALPDAIVNLGDEIVELQGQTALVIEDQYTLHNESANLELVDTVNPVQDKSAQVVEKQNASRFEVAASGHADTITVTESNVELHDQDAPDTSWGEVSNMDFIDIVCEESSENLQNLDASDQATPCVDVANSEPVGVGAPAVQNCQELMPVGVFPSCNQPLSIEVEIQSHNLERSLDASDQAAPCVDVANSEPVGVGPPAVQNCEELMPIGVFPSCNQPLSIEVEIQSHNLERSPSQTAEIADTVVVSHESASQLGENQVLQSNPSGIGSGRQVNLEMISQTAEITDTVLLSHETSQPGVNRELQSNHLGVGIESQDPHATSAGVSSSFWNNVDMSQTHQAGLQLGSVGNLYGFGNPPLYAASLQHELGKLYIEIEQLQKSHGVTKSQLKSDRDKEIMEILAQINSKYDLKLQEAEAEFSHKRNELDKNRCKVLVNKILAESFSSNCGHLLREIQPAASSSIMQHQTLRPLPPMAMGHQPDLGHPITIIPAIQPQQLQVSTNPTRHTVQTPQPPPGFSFVSTSQPPPGFSFVSTSQPPPGFSFGSTSQPPPGFSFGSTSQPPPGFSFGSTSQPLRSPFITPTANTLFRSAAPPLRFMPTPNFQQSQLRPSQPFQLVQGQRLNQTWDNLMSNLVQSHLARLHNVQDNQTPSSAVNSMPSSEVNSSIYLSDDD